MPTAARLRILRPLPGGRARAGVSVPLAVLLIALALPRVGPGFLGVSSAGGSQTLKFAGSVLPPVPRATSGARAEPGPSSGTYPVLFEESGLPGNASYSLTLGNLTENSSVYPSNGTLDPTLQFQVANGTYPLEVHPPPGYVADDVTGPNAPNLTSVNVTGPCEFSVVFRWAYPLHFQADGLPESTWWSVSVQGLAGSENQVRTSSSQLNGSSAAVTSVAFDPARDALIVAEYALSTTGTTSLGLPPQPGEEGFLAEVSAVNGTLLGSIPLLSQPGAVVYDSDDAELFVIGASPNNVTVLSDNGTWVDNLTVPAYRLVVDPLQHEVFALVTYPLGRVLLGINDTTYQVVSSTDVVGGPTALAFDNGTDQLFVAEGSNVSVYTARGIPERVATVAVGFPVAAFAYAPADDLMFVGGGTYLSGISDRTDSVAQSTVFGSPVSGLAFDPTNNTVIVTDGENVSVVSAANGSLDRSVAAGWPTGTWGVLYDPASASVLLQTLGGPGGNDLLAFSDANGSLSPFAAVQPSQIVTFLLPPGTYAYSVSAGAGYLAEAPSGEVELASSNDSPGVQVTFATSSDLSFIVAFYQEGLPVGTTWQVTLDGQTQSTHGYFVYFERPNGLVSYTVSAGRGYAEQPAGGRLLIDDFNVEVGINFWKPTSPAFGVGWLDLPGYEGLLIVGVLVAVLPFVAGRLTSGRGRKPRRPPPRDAPYFGMPVVRPRSGSTTVPEPVPKPGEEPPPGAQG